MASPLNKLTPEQRHIVEQSDDCSLVIASAGTGKTTTIVGKIAHLLEVKQVAPEQILLLTFTNKAAGEMIDRLKRAYHEQFELDKIVSGTFHSVSNRLLRKLPKEVLAPWRSNFTIKSGTALRNTFIHLFKEADLSSELIGPSDLLNTYWYAINLGRPKEDFTDIFQGQAKFTGPIRQQFQQVIDQYEAAKRSYNAMDFNDLLYVLADKLTHYPAIAEELSGRFRHVLVDEYQDTNFLQDRLVTLLSSKHKQLFCVGDYDQTIFSFQGSSIEIIRDFEKKYDHTQVFNLPTNFRSTPEIIDLASAVIAHNERLYPKEITVHRSSGHLHQPQPIYCLHPHREAQTDTVMQSILRNSVECDRKFDNYIPPHETAIIYRSNLSGNHIELACKEYGIPYNRRGGVSFFDRYEIAEALNIVELVHNPQDALAWSKFLSHLPGLGSVSIRQLIDALRATRRGSQSLVSVFTDQPLDGFGMFCGVRVPQGAVGGFHEAQFCLKKLANAHTPSAFFKLLREDDYFRLRIVEHYLKSQKKSKDNLDMEDALDSRTDKLGLLSKLASRYNTLDEFIAAVALQSNSDTGGDPSGVTLLTIHSAKGLEWQKVFLVDIYDGSFPNTRLMLDRPGAVDPKAAVEEERRLFYVAITRAKDQLVINYPKTQKLRGKTEQNPESRFMTELREAGQEKLLRVLG